jgi:hypothetical protein
MGCFFKGEKGRSDIMKSSQLVNLNRVDTCTCSCGDNDTGYKKI